MHPYLLTLNEAALIVLPSLQAPNCSPGHDDDLDDDTSQANTDKNRNEPLRGHTCATVVQVIIKSPKGVSSTEIATFYIFQHEITAAIESILAAHLLSPLPQEVVLEGDGYRLNGVRIPWDYGKRLDLSWGKERLRTGATKWRFSFELTSRKLV
ncbi:hypothetical protein HGRIS_011283 [Hohenbuehelia grisea]|uniref:Uncharacterized protein n=1 Tax=Hohenbuehelia grisea TaxID=104357 RepID=A0ABR3JWC6_9AGAR